MKQVSTFSQGMTWSGCAVLSVTILISCLLSCCLGPKMSHAGTTPWAVSTLWSWTQQSLESPSPWVSEAQGEMGRQVEGWFSPSASFQMSLLST